MEENAPIVFELTGCFIEERFQGLNYHTYIFDLGRPGHLYMSVYDEDVKKIELNINKLSKEEQKQLNALLEKIKKE